MTQQLEACIGVAGDDLNVRIVRDITGQIVQVAVDANGDGSACQALANTGRDFGAGRRRIVLAHRAIG